MKPPSRRLAFAIALTATLAAAAVADERLKGIACRSVHLGFPAPAGKAFYNEVTIEKSAVGTYFMVCGWDKGYFGLQELANGKKLVLFSVWDSGQNNPGAVEEDRRVKTLHKDDKVRVGRFGGEGTGGQSFFDYDWKIGQTYRLMVAARPDGDNRTAYSGYFFVPEENAWKHLITFSTVTGDPKPLRGYYSFVEDFKRDKVSTKNVRLARFGNGWVRDEQGQWQALDKARFTADANPVTNIDAGPVDDRYFLATGGETENKGAALKSTFDRKAAPSPSAPPNDLPEIP